MKRARFRDGQIVRILQEADRSPVAEVAKRHGVSKPSIYAWRKKVGGMGTDDVGTDDVGTDDVGTDDVGRLKAL